MTALRVLVAEDSAEVRRIVIEMLSSDFHVVGEAADGQALIQTAPLLQPDIVVSDIVMPLVDGFSAREQLQAMSFRAPFVFMTLMELGPIDLTTTDGAVGYVHKKDLYNELKIAIRAVAAGQSYISRSLSWKQER
jgi:DNA-binding NarL/FixJ family response regulator